MIGLPYEINFEGRVNKTLKKMAKKDKARYEIVSKRLEEIEEDPTRFKPLRAPLSNHWRAPADNLVILYVIDENSKKVFIYDIAHHDKAYLKRSG
jgi:mRNA-degrading endonuclease RelE of RelBE toxin-antitoxin system